MTPAADPTGTGVSVAPVDAEVEHPTGERRLADLPRRALPVGALAILAYLALHVALAFANQVKFFRPFSQLQAGLALLLCLGAALASRRPEVTAVAAAYVVASEVLWRSERVGMPWEGAKLLLLGLMLIGIARFTPRPVGLTAPLVYVFALLPGSVVALGDLGLVEGLHQVNFAVLPHVALAAGVVFFSNLRVTPRAMGTVLWTLLGPIVTITLTASIDTARLGTADFSGTASNLASSGGFGPNQVSAVVAFGALVAGMLVALERRGPMRLLAAGLAAGFAVQSALTLSRGGLFSVAVVLVALAPTALRNRRSAARVLGILAALVGLTAVLLLPALQELTGGALSERFTSSTTTLRSDIAVADLELWVENPLLGVGVGEGEFQRDLERQTITHTEYTGLLAEHGMLGLIAVISLGVMGVASWRRQVTTTGRIVSLALMVWALATMTHLAVRLAVIPFAFALAAAALVERAERADAYPPADSIGARRPSSTTA